MNTHQKIVVLTGAGISADSGLPTFRGPGGLWRGYDVTQVASPDAWARDPQLVTDFYNERRKKLLQVEPNAGHYSLAKLENRWPVYIVTQNVDDLHERAGSKNILHLHGELLKARSTTHPQKIYSVTGDLNVGEKRDGESLRPHIVWFGEPVPAMEEALQITQNADIFIVAGTSLNVYPAAGLIHHVPKSAIKYIVDVQNPDSISSESDWEHWQGTAAKQLPLLVESLLSEA